MRFRFSSFFCFLCFWMTAIVADFETLESFYQALQEKSKSLKTFQSKIRQSKTLKILAKTLVSEGQVWFKKENQVRWEIKSPEQSTVWILEQKMWCYFPEFKQCEVYDLTQFSQAKNHPGSLFLGIFQDIKTFQKNNRLEFQNVEKTYQLTVTPLQKKPSFRQIRFDFDKNELVPVKILFEYPNGDQTLTEFEELQLNLDIIDKLFLPEFPEETEIIEISPK
ncbi:MAG: outer membrane lipoprotein carrier protein LolA [Planctomycetota bacterium]